MHTSLNTWARSIVEHRIFERIVIGAILANSAVLGMETYRPLYIAHTVWFTVVDHIFLGFFIGELLLRYTAQRSTFFRSPWNWFDLIIVLVSLVPMFGNLSALRALRILRALRLLSVVPEFRKVIESLIRAAQGAFAVFSILALFLYVFAVMSSKLFGMSHPDLFGNLQLSLITHFQLMVFDGWSDIIKTIIATHGFIVFWYFAFFTIIEGFVLISMLIGVIVEAKQTVSNDELKADIAALHTALLRTHRD